MYCFKQEVLVRKDIEKGGFITSHLKLKNWFGEKHCACCLFQMKLCSLRSRKRIKTLNVLCISRIFPGVDFFDNLSYRRVTIFIPDLAAVYTALNIQDAP